MFRATKAHVYTSADCQGGILGNAAGETDCSPHNETKLKQNSFVTVLKQFHYLVRTVEELSSLPFDLKSKRAISRRTESSTPPNKSVLSTSVNTEWNTFFGVEACSKHGAVP